MKSLFIVSVASLALLSAAPALANHEDHGTNHSGHQQHQGHDQKNHSCCDQACKEKGKECCKKADAKCHANKEKQAVKSGEGHSH